MSTIAILSSIVSIGEVPFAFFSPASATQRLPAFPYVQSVWFIAFCVLHGGPEAAIAMSEQYLTEIQVAERTRISLKTLRRWRLENRGPKYSKFGSLVRYGEGDLIQWEQAQPSGGEDPTQRIRVKSERHGISLRKSG